MVNYVITEYILGWESKTSIFDFNIFQERQKTE